MDEISSYKGKFNDCFVYEVKDSIWNSISITELESKIIKHDAFNRLNEINQMGVAWITFPNARHCRFNHSLGVMFVADFLLRNITYLHKDGKGKIDDKLPLINCKFINYPIWQCFRIAALCHDIGHPPLSHVVEEGLRKNPNVIPFSEKAKKDLFIRSIVGKNRYSHEEATKYKLTTGELFSIIQEREIDKTGLEQLPKLAIGEADKFPYNLLNPIINSDLDADKLDYLKRDGFHCGFYTTYDLNDFKGAISISIEKEDDEYQPTLLINKDKIGAVNAFLYSRYREITEVHEEPEVRKATQMAIEFLIQKINSFQIEDEKIKYIVNLHINDQDGDFWNGFKDLETIRQSSDKLRRCNSSDFTEITPIFNNEMKNALDFEDLSPIERLQCHTIMCFPPAITDYQAALRKITKSESLIVDFRTAKPPQFSLYVEVRDDFNIPLFHISDTAKGILRDSISHLNIYFYAKKEESPTILIKDIKNELKNVCNSTMINYYNLTNKIFSHLLILITIGAILENASTIEGFEDPWIIGQLQLQNMIEFICGKEKNPYNHFPGTNADPIFVKDIETLITMGLIVERRMIINYPANKNDLTEEELLNITKVNYINIPRNNYQLNIYGQEYFKELMNFNKKTNFSKEITYIVNKVKEIQGKCKDQLIRMNKTSKEIEVLRYSPDSRLVEIQHEREGYRKFIKEQFGCFVSSKYD